MSVADEGIVQPAAKAVDVLSPRLHQLRVPGQEGREPNSYIRSVIGCGRITNKACARPHHTPSFAYVIHGRQALEVLSQVVGYLRTYKVGRARLLLEEYLSVTPRNGRYSAEQVEARQDFERRFFALSLRAPAQAA